MAVASYRKHMRKYARMSHLDVWYGGPSTRKAFWPRCRRKRAKKPGRSWPRRGGATTCRCWRRRRGLVDDQHHIVEDKPFIVRESHTAEGHPIAKVVDHTLHVYFDSLPGASQAVVRPLSSRRRGAEGGRCGQRRYALLGRPVGLAAITTTRCFSSTRRRIRSVLAPYVPLEPWDCEGRRCRGRANASSRARRTSSWAGASRSTGPISTSASCAT